MLEDRHNPYVLAFGFLAITLLLGGGMTYIARLPNQQATQGLLVSHTQEVIDQLDRLALHVTEAETGQRGYLLTGQDDYLSPYNAALSQINSDLEHFQQLTADNERQQKRVPALRESIRSKLKDLEETVNLRKIQGRDAALQIVSTGRGKEEMTVIRQQINDMKAEEENLLQTRSDAWRLGMAQTRMAVLIDGILMYALICLVLIALLRISKNRKLVAISEHRSAHLQRAEAERLAQIVTIQRDIAGHALNLQSAMQTIAERTQTLTRAEGSIVEMLEKNEMVYRAASGKGAPHIGLRLKAQGSLSGLCVQENAIMKCDDSETDERVDRDACRKVGLRSMVVVPLRYNGKAVGVLKVMSSRIHAFDNDDIATLELIAGLLSATLSDAISAKELHTANLELAAANSRLEKLAITDGLTGLRNHRNFQELLASEFERARRYKKPLSLMLLDVDNFKRFNDFFGHPAGDAVLKRVAVILSEQARATDQVARYGGEEFVILLPETDAQGAQIIAVRILGAIADDSWRHRRVTVSIGISSLADGFVNAASMVEAADKALYISKENGRNQFSHYQAAA
jgi:diguanylate cyclase (GGDEF)-like protein